jgi:hypothetical protein
MDVRKTLLIARWEFVKTITRRTYVIAVVAMPVFYGIMLTVAGVTGRSVSRGESARAIAVVDHAHIIDFEVAREAAEANALDPFAPPGQPPTPPPRLAPYPDVDRAPPRSR